MPDSSTHFVVGALCSSYMYSSLKKARNAECNLGELIVCGALGGSVALLPDMIDPPFNPKHRNIGHSTTMSVLLSQFLRKKLEQDINLSQDNKDFLNSMLLAYISHLAFDAMTPAGLPI